MEQKKNALINVDGRTYCRTPIHTHFVTIGERYTELIRRYVLPIYNGKGFVTISEKVISLCQGRILPKASMTITPLARFLSRFASSSPAGIGVRCVYKMQYAIDTAGALKVLYASLLSALGKLFGRKGVFYRIVGDQVRCLDGFYPDVFPEYGEYGILVPERSAAVCDEIYAATGVPCAIVDANDFTCDVFGKCAALPVSDEEICRVLRDNPAGQSDALTPFVLVTEQAG